jgi:Zn-dependent protease with chaperone function
MCQAQDEDLEMHFRLFLASLIFMSLAAPASAYLDPGAGSFILQMLLAGALAVGATARMYWYRIKAVLSRLRSVEVKRKD